MVHKKLFSNLIKKLNTGFFGQRNEFVNSREIRNTILKIFKLRNSKKTQPLSQKVKITGGVANLYQKVK